jgi:hopanoid biosynthesis associated radical SAM protein HpnH
VHLDGLKEEHDHAVSQEGTFDRAVDAVREAVKRGFRVTLNCTLFTSNAVPEKVAAFLDYAMELGVEGVTMAPGYAYERAPVQDHFLSRGKTKELFRSIFRLGKERKKAGKKPWVFNQSSLYLDFLAGNQTYKCTPWGNPTRNIFGWQRPCYLVGEGYAKSFKELMQTTAWDDYGVGNYEKCANCMVHSGFEPTAVIATTAHPLRALKVMLAGPATEGPMAPEIPLENQRPAQYVFEKQVKTLTAALHEEAPRQAKAG